MMHSIAGCLLFLFPSCGGAAGPILLSRPRDPLRCGLGLQVDGEDEGTQIQETDIVTCSAKVILSRPSHTATGTAAPLYPSDVAFPVQKHTLAVLLLPLQHLMQTCYYSHVKSSQSPVPACRCKAPIMHTDSGVCDE